MLRLSTMRQVGATALFHSPDLSFTDHNFKIFSSAPPLGFILLPVARREENSQSAAVASLRSATQADRAGRGVYCYGSHTFLQKCSALPSKRSRFLLVKRLRLGTVERNGTSKTRKYAPSRSRNKNVGLCPDPSSGSNLLCLYVERLCFLCVPNPKRHPNETATEKVQSAQTGRLADLNHSASCLGLETEREPERRQTENTRRG
ncbi:hypothetical protein Baya_2429 [Bagarius yarrelli]|uniref:Uncharacterized protein n=1 Tax=Bagarius yarrelli TaxID=175774 RepID=A0A556TNX8_BAGYA|nr:hypothetical protein Baya_2429 [Bagarius yarrelli]